MRAVAVTAMSLLATTLGLAAPIIAAPAAEAAPSCQPATIYANTPTGAGRPLLNEYSTTGTLLSSVPLSGDYYDIAFNDDGTTLYGVRESMLWQIDATTGSEVAAIPLTGLPVGYESNALSALPNGSLLTGSSRTTQIFQINPTTGVATPFRASFPAGFGSAGDFLSLADGDILAVGTGTGVSTLFRIKPDNSVVEIGTVPPTFSAAQSAGVIYLPSGSGEIYAVQSLPTSASTAPIAVTSIASTGLYFWGASSPQDSGLCAGLALTKTVSPSASGPYVAGQTVMFTFKVENTGGLAVRDLRIIEGSFSGTGQLGTVTPATVGSLAPGATATFTAGYTLTQADVDAGSLSNTATASAQFSRRSTVTSAASTAALPIRSAPALTLDKAIAAPPGTIFAVGDTVPYRFTVENTGNVTLSGVRIVENAFSGSGTMSAVSPATVAPLAPGASAVFSASYVVTTADVAAGSVTNTATATASAPDRTLLASAPSTVAARMAVVPSPSPTAVPTPAPTNTSGSGAVPQPSTSASAGASVGRLASTGGTPALPAVMMGGGALIAGLAIVLLRRSRRMR